MSLNIVLSSKLSILSKGIAGCFFYFGDYKKGIKFQFFQKFLDIILRNTIVLSGEAPKHCKLRNQITVLERSFCGGGGEKRGGRPFRGCVPYSRSRAVKSPASQGRR